MYKNLLLTLGLALGTITGFASETITIGASPNPHAKMLNFIKPALEKEGYTLKVTEFSDYVTPNLAVIQKQLDANFFQHQPYLDQFNKDHHSDLVSLVKVHLEPMGVFANKKKEKDFAKTKQASSIAKGAKIGVPNDPTNEGRALNILQENGVLTLTAGVNYPTKKDIVTNPYNVKIVELDPAMLPRILKAGQLDIAIINSNIALQSNLRPGRDAVWMEKKDSPFANLIAVRPDEINEPKMKALAKAITSPEMKQFIEQNYKGEVIPAF